MGGERETVAEQRKRDRKTGKPEKVGSVRFHESGGEIHFHDDNNKLKVAIPSGVWHEAWERLSSGRQKRFEYADVLEKSRLVVKIDSEKKDKSKALEAFIKISPIELGSTFESLQKFTAGN